MDTSATLLCGSYLVPWRAEKKVTRETDRSPSSLISSHPDSEDLESMRTPTFCAIFVPIGALTAENASLNHYGHAFQT